MTTRDSVSRHQESVGRRLDLDCRIGTWILFLRAENSIQSAVSKLLDRWRTPWQTASQASSRWFFDIDGLQLAKSSVGLAVSARDSPDLAPFFWHQLLSYSSS